MRYTVFLIKYYPDNKAVSYNRMELNSIKSSLKRCYSCPSYPTSQTQLMADR